LNVPVHGRNKILGFTVTALQAVGRGEVGRVYHFQDLTELRRLEREVKIRDRMAALGRLAAGIAHEIRNPLASMAGSVKLLTSFGPLDDDQRKIADIVIKESERLNRIISDFLNYAREGQYKFTSVELRTLVEDVLVLVRNSPRCGSGIRIESDLGAAPIHLRADPDRLKQVVWNLCDNACKAMNGKGTLTVKAQPSVAGVRIEFRDTGCGLKPGTEDQIFEPFHSGFRDGTGLGLATVYTIVEAHHGKIWVESPPEGGARFVLQLPLETRGEKTEKEEVAVALGKNVRRGRGA
jgi:two-component system sensor histidine kinase PilS (NtrC family)